MRAVRFRFWFQFAVFLLVASVHLDGRQTTAPGAPRDLAVSVSGNLATLTWRAPATGGPVAYYLIQVGSTSGAADLGSFNVGGMTSVSASAANGRYFVRIVAVNGAGSAASSEVSVVIGPTPLPPQGLRCVAFSPYVAGYSPRPGGTHPPASVIDALVDRVANETDYNCLMTYGVLNGLDHTFAAARRRGLRVIAGLRLEGTAEAAAEDSASIALAVARAHEYSDTIVRIACGIDVRTRLGAAAAEQIVGNCAARMKGAGVTQPIGTNDGWWFLCNESIPCQASGVAALDWIGLNAHPWWENRYSGLYPCLPAGQAAQWIIDRILEIHSVYPNKELILTEFGWPAGPTGYSETNERTGQTGCGVASRASQQMIVAQVSGLLRQYRFPHVAYEAFSQPYKVDEGPVAPFWGILPDGQ